jgi:hypothetical protein
MKFIKLTTQLLNPSISLLVLMTLVSLQPSCITTKSDEQDVSMNSIDVPLNRLKRQALDSGNIESYDRLAIVYMDLPHGEFIDVAFVMANKYDYDQSLLSTKRMGYTLSLDSCDEQTRIQAIECLQKAYELGHHQAMGEMNSLIKQGFIVKEDSSFKKLDGENMDSPSL